MHPDLDPVAVGAHRSWEPVWGRDPGAAVAAARRLAPCIEAGESVLSDGDRVVLAADVAAIVEQRDAGRIEGAAVARLSGKSHEIAGPAVERRFVDLGSFVPERQGSAAPVC